MSHNMEELNSNSDTYFYTPYFNLEYRKFIFEISQ